MKKLQTVYLVSIGFITMFLLTVHTFSLLRVVVDTYSLLLLGILILIPVIPSFKKIKWGEFEAEISSEEITKIDKAFSKIKPLAKSEIKGYTREEAEELKNYLSSLAEVDPILALAKLRMELENVVRTIYKTVIKKRDKRIEFMVPSMISALEKEGTITTDVAQNVKEVMMLCNKAIHGEIIKSEDAIHVVTIGMKIIEYFYGYYTGYSTGYSNTFSKKD